MNINNNFTKTVELKKLRVTPKKTFFRNHQLHISKSTKAI